MSAGQRQRVRIACYFWEILRGTEVTWRTDAKISIPRHHVRLSRSTEVEREHWHVCNINERNWPDNEMQEQCCLWAYIVCQENSINPLSNFHFDVGYFIFRRLRLVYFILLDQIIPNFVRISLNRIIHGKCFPNCGVIIFIVFGM